MIDVDGAPAYALRATLKNGDQHTYYLDPDAMLDGADGDPPAGARLRDRSPDTDFGDYEKVERRLLPVRDRPGPRASSQVSSASPTTSLVANAPVDRDLRPPLVPHRRDRPAAEPSPPASSQMPLTARLAADGE